MPSQGSVQQHGMRQLRDESKDPPVVIAVSEGEEFDDVEPASSVLPVPSFKPVSHSHTVGKTKRKTSAGMTGNACSPLVVLLAKPRQSVTSSSSQGTYTAAVPSPVTSAPHKRSTRQVTMSDDEWLQFQ